MKTLGTDIEKYRNEVIAALESAESKLVEAIDGFNAELEAHRALVEAAVARYNEVVADAESLKADAQSSIQDYFDGRSEKWQEGEKGEKYQTWIDDFDSLDLSEIDVELPDAIEPPNFEARAAIEQEWPELAE